MNTKVSFKNISFFIILAVFQLACSTKKGGEKEEQLRINLADTVVADTASMNSIQGNLSLSQLNTKPNRVILTGMPQHRLVTIYRVKPKEKQTTVERYSSYSDSYYRDYEESDYDIHFMPGIDLQYGYNLVNIAHYDLQTEKMNYFFDHPVLIKSLYYPSFEQDSLHKKPINRNYYLTSVYDADTNTDTLINRKDLRRFYYFNEHASEKIQLLPADYSVVRSQYDSQNDVMYIYATHDANKNGTSDKEEPLHIFWIRLAEPKEAKRLY